MKPGGNRVEENVACSLDWLRLNKITYRDEHGKLRNWEMVERTTRKGSVDAVAILALLSSPDTPPRTVLITQYRPAVDGVCVELPAGLIDDGETAQEAAVRELKEETGLCGNVLHTSPVVYNDPGITNANMALAVVKVDMDDVRNKNPQPCFGPGEMVETLYVPFEDVYNRLLSMQTEGYCVDARLLALFFGLNMSHTLPSLLTTTPANE